MINKNFFKVSLISLILIFSIGKILNAEDSYVFIYGGLGNNEAKDPHDTAGSTYKSDPDDQATVFGIGYGKVINKNEKSTLSSELEFSMMTGAKIELLDSAYAEPTTRAFFGNLIYSKFLSDKNVLKAGGGLGFSLTKVETDYDDGSTTFSGENDNDAKFSYNLSLGIGRKLENNNIIDLSFRYSHFGAVEGASGAANTGATYYADKFDNVYKGLLLTYKFSL